MLFSNFNPIDLIAALVALVVSLTFHEFSHAWTADQFGDYTPRMNGRLTLNPIHHLDPIGSIMILIIGFGWAKPVPINPYALQRRSPAAPMLVALAGPASNLLLAIVSAIIYRLLLFSSGVSQFSNYVLEFLFAFGTINIALMIFNLIPIPPLDGDKILEYLLPRAWSNIMDPIRQFGPMILMGLVVLGFFTRLNVLGAIIYPPMQALMSLLF